MIEAGIKGVKSLTVMEKDTAEHIGSGFLPVFATPAMIALMEATAAESVAPFLEAGVTSVGTKISVSHLSADPVGAVVTCESILTEAEGRRLVFSLTVKDNTGIVGEGTHERFLVKSESFMKKALSKLEAIL